VRAIWEVLRVQREACREGGVPLPFLALVEDDGSLVVRWRGAGSGARAILLGNLRRTSPCWLRWVVVA
jgi:hypothetical protein